MPKLPRLAHTLLFVASTLVLSNTIVQAAPVKPERAKMSVIKASTPALVVTAIPAPPNIALAAAVPVPTVLTTTTPATDGYTGILIDARALPGILRSPAPAIYGPGPDSPLLYPDRSDVPTPDEVQDESIVRYYHTEAEAQAGVAGSHPLILQATAVLGPAKDALQLSAADMSRLQDLEKTLHFTETWKVGFLIPSDH